ncbi:MAG: ABC transporter ATP-binding protein [Deltaproteobacteria bacterium]|nr:ABC transporter ATP-binding protein [Deltaproteobacteria bacterium]
MVLKLADLGKTFPGKNPGEWIPVLDNINCSIEAGQFVSIVGSSGCGKTTLLRIIAGLEKASRGRVFLNGREVQEVTEQIGLVFQEYALFPWRTTAANIQMGLEIKGVDKSERERSAGEYIRAFGLQGFEDHYPRELSGGMQQRVAIARTLIMNPRVVLMDEPFASLDSQTRNDLQEFLLSVWQKRGDTVVFVTHNVEEAVFLSDQIIILSRRPARIERVLQVESPRPRDRTDPEFNTLRRTILQELKKQKLF